MKVSVVAGGAGFIGSNLLRFLSKENRHLVILDDLCRGREEYLNPVRNVYSENIHFMKIDLSDSIQTLKGFEFAQTFGDVDEVWHLAANSDIPAGILDSKIDLRDTFMTTFSLLEAMRKRKVGTMHFASSSAIYGDMGNTPIHEAIGPLFPISNYGAMKLASEALISAAAESFLDRANIFRFPNVVGSPATHGVILDFINKLICTPDRLVVLGDGTQKKSYLHVSDLVDAMIFVSRSPPKQKIDAINVGPSDAGVSVRWIAETVAKRFGTNPKIHYGIGNKGWVGDVPRFEYSIEKISAYGWAPKYSSESAIKIAIDEIAKQLGR